jgi:hypothetical protein
MITMTFRKRDVLLHEIDNIKCTQENIQGEKMAVCAFCNKRIEIEGKVFRSTECPYCGADVRCCVNCRFHSRGAHNQCLESQAEWVGDKERANFCDYFQLNTRRTGDSVQKTSPEETARKWDALFGRKDSDES